MVGLKDFEPRMLPWILNPQSQLLTLSVHGCYTELFERASVLSLAQRYKRHDLVEPRCASSPTNDATALP